MTIQIPEFAFVVLIGPSGSGKSTFAARHFLPTEVLSSDYCRALVSDDENSMDASQDAFDVLHYVAAKRLARKRLTVVDATNVQAFARKGLLKLAKQYHVLPVAIVLNLPEAVCQARNEARPDRDFGPHVVRNHLRDLKRSLRYLRKEGFRYVHVLTTPEEVDAVTIERTRLWNDKRDEHGPFDFIGDVHGCRSELDMLLAKLGYVEDPAHAFDGVPALRHPEGRQAFFVGDLVDRGPDSLGVYRRVRAMVEAGTALAVPGNHDDKLVRKLRGRKVKVAHGLEQTLGEIAALHDETRPAFERGMADFLSGLVSHYVLDEGRLVVAHAGMREDLQGRTSRRVRDFALYGETTGETDEFGLPVRHNWAAEYRGSASVVYGHTPVPHAEWLNDTINIDTGCVFGGQLTALRWPERELVAVPAAKTYAEPARPFLETPADSTDLTAQQLLDQDLDLADVAGKQRITTRLRPTVTIREEQATAALEVMSRFAADPRWLVYLPPTMSPVETSTREGYLEHPAEAFAYYRERGQATVVCEEKHMGSRAVVVVCRDAEAAARRFGVNTSEDGATGEDGIVYTRTGRRFFEDQAVETALLDRVRRAMDAAGFWERFSTDWAVLDAELMPWSAKAQALLRQQYAATGAAARAALPEVVDVLARANEAGLDVANLLQQTRTRLTDAERFTAAYRGYCWPVESVEDLRLAPFHLLATEGAVHIDKDHRWHMDTLADVVAAGDETLHPTAVRVVDVTDPEAAEAATAWWVAMTEAGGEGMVVKPLDFVARGKRGLIQPAVKCRGREYLRIIYGPEYTRPEHLERLRRRGLKRKRSLALREFALGVEGLERFVRQEPLRRVHACAFGVLALESDPVDPRL
ncbi:MAG: polynucleotide kinase-phosphatase [Bacteroidota bacterium]